MTEWSGYKGNRPSVTDRINSARAKAAEEIDVPLLWLPAWDELTAAQRYRIQRGLL